jgi:hypothetical protein
VARGLALCLLASCGRVGFEAPASWWSPVWPYREAIVFDHTKVAEDLTDFPALVTTKIDDTHVAFVDSANVELSFELDTLAPLTAWVKLPLLSSTADTTIYLYYGNHDQPDHAQRADVWSNGYTGVYHFGDGVTLDARDSRAVNDGTIDGARAAAGQIGGAASFDGTANVAVSTLGLDATPGGVNTVTFWLFYQEPFDTMPIAFQAQGSVGTYDLWFQGDGCEGFNTGNGEVLGSGTSMLASRWVHVAAMFYNGVPTVSSSHLYFDGVEQPLAVCSIAPPNAPVLYPFAYWGGVVGSSDYRMTGLIDEGRLAVGARSAAWIQTEHANQADPASFESFGSVETF